MNRHAEAPSANTAARTGTTRARRIVFGMACLGLLGLVFGSSLAAAAAKPDVSPEALWEPTPTSIQLNALVNPHGEALTDCHFEYGAGGSLDRTAPCESPDFTATYTAPEGEGDALVSARIGQLAPGTSYSFRLVATNGVGTGDGATQSFETPKPGAAGSCPNQAIREQQQVEDVPRCRAWEKVSPADKNNGDINPSIPNIVAASDGNAISFKSRAAFGDQIGSAVGGQTDYVARRGPEGWSTHGIDPTPNPQTPQSIQLGGTVIPMFSEDLRTALTWGYDLPSSTTDTPERKNIYIEDTGTRALTPITVSQADPLEPFDFATLEATPDSAFAGLSADAQHVLLSVRTRLLPEAPPGVTNLYEWSNGALHLVNVLPDGTVSPEGGTVKPLRYRGAISHDGSRAIFLSPAEGERQLYLRIDGNRTVWISEPEATVPPAPQGAFFQSMTPDGKHVFFVSYARLLDGDTNDGPDLYRYDDGPDPEHEANLTLISHSGTVDPGTVDHGEDSEGFGENALLPVLGTSADGKRVYYWDRESIFFWDEGVTHRVAQGVPPRVAGNNLELVLGADAWGEYAGSRVSPDGAWLAFLTTANPTHQLVESHISEHGIEIDPPEMYLYDARNNTLRCASCLREGVNRYGASVKPEINQSTLGDDFNLAIRPHFLADDGTVFFSAGVSLVSASGVTTYAGEGLVPGDTNGVADLYEYNPSDGVPALLSTGRGADPTVFADASRDGSDVFALTRGSLVREDSDALVDMYDLRVGGGFAEAPPPPSQPCASNQCGGGASAPATAALASEAQARGNQRHRQRGRRHCRGRSRSIKRCAKRHHGKHRVRAAGNNRGIVK